MPRYQYTARDAAGNRVTGEAEAAGTEALAGELAARGLRLEQAAAAPPPTASSSVEYRAPALSESELVTVAQRVADASRAGLPLAPGLRALAQEVSSRRLKRALAQMCRELEAGAALESVLTERRNVPPHLAELVRSGIRTGKLELVLDRYIGGVRVASEVRHNVAMAFAYPAVLTLVGIGILTAIMVAIVPQFKSIFSDFGVELPAMTAFSLMISDVLVRHGWAILALLAVAAATVGLGAAAFGWGGRLRWVVDALPWVGQLKRLSALAEYSQLLSLLLDCKVPLPEALRLVGQGSRDAELAAASEVIAEDVRHGSPLTDSAARRSTLPQGLRQLLRWAERPQTFSEVLRAASEMFEARARMQSAAIAPFIEPMLIVGLGLSVGFILISLFLPLMKLLNDLS